MRAGRWAWTIAGGLLAVVLVGWGAWSTLSLIGRDVREETATFDAVAVIEVRGTGSIRVIEGTDDRVVVHERIEESVAAVRRSAEVVDDRLVLASSCRPAVSTFCSVSYEIEAPVDTDLVLRTDSGSIRVAGIEGAVEARSSGGGITVDGGGGALRLRSSAGGVTVLGTRATDVEASSSAGRVELDVAVAPDRVDASSSAGGVSVRLPRGEELYAVDASSSAGDTDVQVRTDPASGRTIRATSSAGGVTVSYR